MGQNWCVLALSRERWIHACMLKIARPEKKSRVSEGKKQSQVKESCKYAEQ